jgi:hypothetical protein
MTEQTFYVAFVLEAWRNEDTRPGVGFLPVFASRADAEREYPGYSIQSISHKPRGAGERADSPAAEE